MNNAIKTNVALITLRLAEVTPPTSAECQNIWRLVGLKGESYRSATAAAVAHVAKSRNLLGCLEEQHREKGYALIGYLVGQGMTYGGVKDHPDLVAAVALKPGQPQSSEFSMRLLVEKLGANALSDTKSVTCAVLATTLLREVFLARAAAHAPGAGMDLALAVVRKALPRAKCRVDLDDARGYM
jgi:hypothetical protein